MGGGRNPIRRGGPIEVFLENVSAIHRDAGGSSLGRRLLDNSWIDFAGVGAGTNAELQALISVLIKPEMTISSALLYVNSTNTIPGTSTANITSGISGSNLTWEYDIGAPNAARYFWVELIDDNANSSITPLGVYTTEDNTPPIIREVAVLLGTPPTTSLQVLLDVTDNDAVQTIYVLLNDTQDTNPGPALLKTIGDAFAGGTTSHTYTGLTPNTTYYTWVMAKDQVGNESVIEGPISRTTNADTTAPTVDSFSLVAGTDAESQVSISLTISDA
eukprot:jgi/Tetstr1/422775/TSEL_013572.t1